MLRYLYVKDFVLIDELEVGFNPGLNILTGETGAGKTIIIGALNAVLGERITAQYIRVGSERGIIRALFEVEGEFLEKVLYGYGLTLDDKNLILQREIIKETGKHICRINGQIVTLGILTEIGKRLVDIHGQHEHQSLLNPSTQLKMLDRYGNLQSEVEKVADLYKQLTNLAKKLQKLTLNEEEKEKELKLLKFELEEIRQSNLQPEEEEQLKSEVKILRNREKLYQWAQESCQHLEEFEGIAILPNLYQVIKKLILMKEFDDSLSESLKSAQNHYYQLQELSRSLKSYLHRIEFEPHRLEKIEVRLDLLAKLKYKYGQTIEEILSYADKISQKIDAFTHQEEDIKMITEELNKTISQLEPLSNWLSESRERVAQDLQLQIVRELTDLGMKKTVFEIKLQAKKDENSLLKLNGQPKKITSTGFDEVEFLISPNPGQPLKPLAHIASGGELSRVMLAIKSILAQVDEIPTLIFDEIDTGIGPKMGQKVGQKLFHISQSRQIVCITHLPQIAAYADTHLYVEKRIEDEKAQTQVKRLSQKEHIYELALLLDGDEISETSLKHAQELLEKAEILGSDLGAPSKDYTVHHQ